MKKWAFLFMVSLAIFFLFGCNSESSTTLETTTTVTTTEEVETTVPTTSGGTISETTLYVVQFDSGGAGDISDLAVEGGQNFYEPVVTKVGYTLNGWFLSDDNGVTFIKKWDFTIDVVTANIKLFAVWDINQYSLTFESNGGSLVETLTQDYGTEIIPQEPPLREGYTFSGWYLDEGLTEVYLFSTMPAHDFTVYAKWSPVTYELHYYILPDDFNPFMDEIVLEAPRFVSVALGGEFTIGLSNQGEIFAWGDNEYAQLGNGLSNSKYRPINITEFFNLNENDQIIQISAGYMHSAVLSQMGRLYLWGDNEDGQLGIDDTFIHMTPVDITDNFDLLGEEKIIKVELGNYFSSALTSSGRLFMWGYNTSGELGDGGNVSRQMPYDITSNFGLAVEEKIVDVSLGGSHALALTSNNRIFSWGYNNNMQLGDGTTTSRNTPGEITSQFTFASGETITQVAAGNHHSAVVTSLGEVYTFGFNFYGQLGDGSTLNKGTPTNITGQFTLGSGEKVERVTLGVHFSSAITNQSNIYTWGLNASSQLGDGTIINRSNPINISSLFSFGTDKNISDIALGDRFMAIVDSEGLMYLWGDNNEGKLGIGSIIFQPTPQNPTFIIPEVIVMAYLLNEIDELLVPERIGDTFLGWYKDLHFAEAFDDVLNPDGPTILYSNWSSYPAIILQETGFLEAEEIHYFYFTLDVAATISAYTISEIDTYGTLMDDSESVIEENDDSINGGYNFLIEYELEPGTYIITVEAYDSQTTGDYTIVIIKN